MCFRSFIAVLVIRVLIGILLLQLVGCGNSPSVGQTPTEQTPVDTPTPTSSDNQSPPSSLLSHNPSGAFDIPGVFHITGDFRCSINGSEMAPVLATDRLTYSSGEISQMATYVDSLPNNRQRPPDTLLEVAGGFLEYIPYWDIYNLPDWCGGDIEITNIGQSSIQIVQMDMKFTADSQLNNYHYNLIDACSLPLNDSAKFYYCPLRIGGTGTPYQYHYDLVSGQKGTVVQGQATQQLILSPGDTIDVAIYFTETRSSGSYIYSLMPELTISTSSQQDQVLDLPQLSSIVAFVDPNQQLSCYQLRGDTFVSLSEGPVQTSADTTLQNNSVYCL